MGFINQLSTINLKGFRVMDCESWRFRYVRTLPINIGIYLKGKVLNFLKRFWMVKLDLHFG